MPLSWPRACTRMPLRMRISKFSLTALGLPGRLIMRVLPRVPKTALERHAEGTILHDS